MGGISLGTAASAGMSALNLINNVQNNNKNMEYLQQSRQASARHRKNLLEQQLANRRAGFGAMGITADKSALAVQQRLIKDSYQEQEDENLKYRRQYESLQNANRRNIQQSLLGTLSVAGKLIK